jgi:hypothetical protein
MSDRAQAALPPRAATPVFVGGTGRSGTHAMARMLGQHSAYHYFSREMRFHTDRGGFPDLLSGELGPEEFVANMRGRFWRRTGADGEPRGLYAKLDRQAYDGALERFLRDYEEDVRRACERLMHALVDPVARKAGKPTWIEQTPPTVAAAETLHAIFPQMKIIHMVRDGRDVACSVIRKPWGPASVTGAIDWWDERMRECHAATSRIPAESYYIVHLEDLAERKRPRTYKRVLRFLGIEDETRIRRYFRREISAEAANVGRWKTELSESEQRKVNRLYRRTIEQLKADGITGAPGLGRAGFSQEPEPEDDSWLRRARPSRR